ncbi:MAG: pyridoxamine 5'-phosphate oxidase [Paracoccaceae bacterium]|nr:pyridoxamine 5'-phosphate oxidase [Paracoccaceae bacterium]
MQRTGIFAGEDPFRLAQSWLDAAGEQEIADPNAMALATVDPAGMPNVRMVLLKAIEANAFVFYTNYDSAKGEELAANPAAAFTMHWKSLKRQLRARGPVEREEGSQADAYYSSRALQSRLGAWASKQSRPLASREALMAEVARAAVRHGTDPGRPPHWGGFRLTPVEIEFWADGAFRLHDRFRWRRETTDGAWRVERVAP